MFDYIRSFFNKVKDVDQETIDLDLEFPSFKKPLPLSRHLTMTEFAERMQIQWENMPVSERERISENDRKAPLPTEQFRL